MDLLLAVVENELIFQNHNQETTGCSVIKGIQLLISFILVRCLLQLLRLSSGSCRHIGECATVGAEKGSTCSGIVWASTAALFSLAALLLQKSFDRAGSSRTAGPPDDCATAAAQWRRRDDQHDG